MPAACGSPPPSHLQMPCFALKHGRGLPLLRCLRAPQPLVEGAANQPVAGNQLVAVLRQLQGMLKR